MAAGKLNVEGIDVTDADNIPSLSVLDKVDIDTVELQGEADKIFGSKIPLWVKIVIAAVLLTIFFVSFALGKYPITPLELLQVIGERIASLFYGLGNAHNPVEFFQILAANFSSPAGSTAATVVFNIRLPRVLCVLLVGAALAVAGASYQGMFKNPLVSPDILGASAGASLGACLALLLNQSSIVLQIWAFLGGMLAVGMAVWLNKMVRYDPVLGLVLGGILVSTLFQSGLSLVKFMADANDKLPTITFWLMGSFASIDQRDLALCFLPMLIGFSLLLTQRAKLNVLSFGEEEARSLGVNTRRTRFLVIFASTLLSSSSVAIAGIVGWIGLVIPHLARAIVGPNYRVLLPTAMAVGAGYLLIVDDFARLLTTLEIPIGILTAILGVPFFVIIFRHNMRGWK